ncbi:MAG: hypothetical protein KDD50_03260 [Bdellovibrionales bacterium]|nr:hypothetical protein [Bdellovibrionales bacterium]
MSYVYDRKSFRYSGLIKAFMGFLSFFFLGCSDIVIEFPNLFKKQKLNFYQTCNLDVQEKSVYLCDVDVSGESGAPASSFIPQKSNSSGCPWVNIGYENGKMTLTGTPKNDDVGSCRLLVDHDESNSFTFDPLVLDIQIENTAPELSQGLVQIYENSGSITAVNLESSDEGTIGYYALGVPVGVDCSSLVSNLSVDGSSGDITLDTLPDLFGSCFINVVFTDGHGQQINKEFELSVLPVNSIPNVDVFTCDASATEGSLFTCSVFVSDPDLGDTPSVQLSLSNECSWVSTVSGSYPNYTVTGTPQPGDAGSCDLKIQANDGIGGVSADSIKTISINAVAPSFTNVSYSTDIIKNALSNLIFDVSSDKEGFGVTYSLVTSSMATDCQSVQTSSGIQGTNGKLYFQPMLGFVGTCYFRIKVEDSFTLSAEKEYQVNVLTNSAPTISQACSVNQNEGDYYSCDITVGDPDTGVLGAVTTLQISSTNCGFLNLSGSFPNYQLKGGITNLDVGSCVVNLAATDQEPLTKASSFSIAINNLVPSLVASNVSITENDPAQIIKDLSASDEGDAGSSYSLLTSVATPSCSSYALSLSIDSLTGAITFQPKSGITGVCYIRSQFDDGLGGQVQAEFAVNIQPLNSLVVESVYPLNAQWNDYIKNDELSKTIYSQSDDACLPSDTGKGPDICIHAGQMRKVVTGFNSCSNYTAQDSEGVFRWICNDNSGYAVFYSVGFLETKGLADLIRPGGWKSIKVDFYLSNSLVNSTNLSQWWTNPIIPLPPNDAPLDTPGAIYTIATSREDQGHQILADRVAVTTLGGAIVTFNNGTNNLYSSGKNFLWFEGNFVGGSSNALRLEYSKFSRIRNVFVSNNTTDGISLYHVNNSRIENIKGSNLHWDVVYLQYSSNNYLTNIFGSNTDHTPVHIRDSSENNIVTNVYGLNTVSSISITASHYNTIRQVSGVNLRGGGIYERSSSKSNLINNAAFLNSKHGIDAEGSLNTRYYKIVASQYTSAGVYLYNASNAEFHDWMAFSSTMGVKCNIVGGTDPGLQNGSCTSDGLDMSNNYAGINTGSTARLLTNIDLSQSLQGPVMTDDVVNASDSNGQALANAISDWMNFENWYRAWGRDGSGYPNASLYDWCQDSESCRIWDLSVKITDSVMLDKGGDGYVTNDVFTPGSPCPTQISGNEVITDSNSNPNTFLKMAQEIFEDGVGDDDGLCESNEQCVFSPNIGAYQGHGDPLSGSTCVFQGGVISGVKMYSYPNQGF